MAIAILLPSGDAVAQDQEGSSLVQRVQKLFDASERGRVVAPAPGSRSIIVAVDGSSPMYLYLERGSIRGNAIDTFYDQYESGELDAAYQTFLQNSTIVMRMSDYGWNGLGNPMVTEEGTEIDDVFYTVTEGRFQMTEPSQEDVEQVEEMLETIVVPALSDAE